MGHAGQSLEGVMLNDSKSLFGFYKQHFSDTTNSTHLALVQSLRSLHPGRSIACSERTDPIKFAEAGFAKAVLVHRGSDFLSRLQYIPEPNRLGGGDGKVEEEIDFGEYEYEFQGQTSSVYNVHWTNSSGCTEAYHYYVSPQDDAQSDWARSLIKAAGKWQSELHEEIYIFDSGFWSKNSQLWASVQGANWADVILDPAMKKTLIKDVEGFFESRAVYEQYAVPWKRGIIIHGTPGCGKTISIKALLKTMQSRGVVGLYVKSLASDNNTRSSGAIRDIFQFARRMAPCILIFEDLDSLVHDDVRSYFLNEVDGLEDNQGILMIGSTNHLERLDPGISKRPSRFDRKYHYKLPGEKERILYCEYWREKLQGNSGVDFSQEVCKVVAQLTDGFSFAYMKELFVQTLLALVGGRADDDVDEFTIVPVDVAVTDVAEVAAATEQLAQPGIGAGSEAGTTGETANKQRSARQMPNVEIPDSLKTNKLVRVLQREIRVLWKDMDNTTDEVHG